MNPLIDVTGPNYCSPQIRTLIMKYYVSMLKCQVDITLYAL